MDELGSPQTLVAPGGPWGPQRRVRFTDKTGFLPSGPVVPNFVRRALSPRAPRPPQEARHDGVLTQGWGEVTMEAPGLSRRAGRSAVRPAFHTRLVPFLDVTGRQKSGDTSTQTHSTDRLPFIAASKRWRERSSAPPSPGGPPAPCSGWRRSG